MLGSRPSLLLCLIFFFSKANGLFRMQHEDRDVKNKVSLEMSDLIDPSPKNDGIEWIPSPTKIDPRSLYMQRHGNHSKFVSVNITGGEKSSFTCDGKPYAFRTPDYEPTRRDTCVMSDHQMAGYMFSTAKNPTKVYEFVEVFKSGCSFTKTQLKHFSCDPKHLDPHTHLVPPYRMKNRNCINILRKGYEGLISDGVSLDNVTGFAFVRHPVLRFISGYGTVLGRMNGWMWHQNNKKDKIFELCKLKEPTRFNAFVDHVTSKGIDILNPYLENGRIPPLAKTGKGHQVDSLIHLLSQSWFMSRYPGRIHYIGRVENLTNDAQYVFEELLKVPFMKELKHANAHEGADKRLSTSDYLTLKETRPSIDKLNHYFRHELDVFGYKPL